MANFPYNRPSGNVEGKGADTFTSRSKAGSNAGSQRLLGAWMATLSRWGNQPNPRSGSGESRSGSFASAQASGGAGGRSAESYHNENLMNQYAWEREQKGKDKDVHRAGRHMKNVTKNTPEGRTWKNVSGDASKGAFNYTWEDAPKPAAQPETPKGESGNKPGRQFLGANIPVAPGERPGAVRKSSEGKFEANPAYGDWKSDKAKFETGLENQDRTQLHLPTTQAPAAPAAKKTSRRGKTAK